MDDAYTPSTDETPHSNDIAVSGPFVPSDFLPQLPSSSTPMHAKEALHTPTPPNDPNANPKDPIKLQVDAQGRTLNPRSCVTCRKRKVKCDKIHPCTNCNRAHIECVFPSPGRAPRKTRKIGEGRDKELLERLRRLEGVVKGLGVDVPEDGVNGTEATSSARVGAEEEERVSGKAKTLAAQDDGATKSLASAYYDGNHEERTKWVDEQQTGRFENRFGRLVVNEGKSRYINNSFWANLSNEVEDLKGILNQESEDEDIVESPTSNAMVGSIQHGWVFGFSSQSVDLLSLHPLPGQIATYWEIYKDRVDPLVKMLHIPTIEPTILRAASHLSNLSKGFEALLFAIYYGATTSVNSEHCVAQFGEEKPVLLARYRFAIEQALARANFLTTEETIILQAFVVFLICLRRNNDARVIWTLTGLVVRIAQTIGVHRDGTHFGLPPFEIEMRRRLWWQVCILDTRASEDHGCDPTIVEQSFDTKLPLNINDADISPDMQDFPAERVGCTDISFCLIRCEVANTFRRINYIPPGSPRACNAHFTNVTLEDKEKWITECHTRLEERYLKDCDMNVPLFWVTATVARLIMSKMWLMVYHPFQRQNGGATLPEETKEKLFITSLENIEYSILLETEVRTMKWGWLFKTYMQWHALAFLLSELCHRTTGPLVDRAWIAVEKAKDGRWGARHHEETRADHLWRPLKKLYRKAKEARTKGLRQDVLASKGQMGLPVGRSYSPNERPMFESARPRVTRAPLSSAQLERLRRGPSFGEMPVDKHDLFASSPREEEVAGKQRQHEQQQQQQQQRTEERGPSNGIDMSTFNSTNNALPASKPLQPNAPFDPTLYLPSNITAVPNIFDNQLYPPPDFINGTTNPPPTRLSSFDSLDPDTFDLSVMDTSDDINWTNWDGLVPQFGVDVDSVPGMGLGMDWTGGGQESWL